MTFAITINEKGGEPKRLEFEKPEVTIGRVQGNDIILPKNNVSKRHSRIVFKDGKFIIVDLKSTNGTYVNGRKITSPLVIKGSDKVYIGDFVLAIEEPEGAAADLAPPQPRRQTTVPPPPPPTRRPSISEADAPAAIDLEAPPADHAEASPSRMPDLDEEIADVPRPRTSSPPIARPVALPRPTSRPVPTLEEEISGRPAPEPVREPAPEPVREPPREPLPAVSTPVARPAAATRPPAPREPRPTVQPARPTAPPARPTVPPRTAAVEQVDESIRGPACELMQQLNERLAEQLKLTPPGRGEKVSPELWMKAERAVQELIDGVAADGGLPPIDRETLGKSVVGEVLGIGPLEELLGDETVQTIEVPRHDRIFIERDGVVSLADRWFSSPEAVATAVERLTDARPSQGIVETRLPGGVLVTAALPPLVERGAVLTLRRPHRQAIALADLVERGAMSQEMADYLSMAIEQRRSVLVSGAPGGGRSLLIGALANAMRDGERVISIEETEDLQLRHTHWVQLTTSTDGLAMAMRGALRLRPDRLVVAELRGPEARDFLVAASAVPGSVAGIYGTSTGDALDRFQTLAALSGGSLGEIAGRALNLIIQVGRGADGERRVLEIAEVTAPKGGAVGTSSVYVFQMASGEFVAVGDRR